MFLNWKRVAVLYFLTQERLPDSLESARQNAESFGIKGTTRGQFCRSTVRLYLVKKYLRIKFGFSLKKLKPVAVLLVHAHERLPYSLARAQENAESFYTARTTRRQFCTVLDAAVQPRRWCQCNIERQHRSCSAETLVLLPARRGCHFMPYSMVGVMTLQSTDVRYRGIWTRMNMNKYKNE